VVGGTAHMKVVNKMDKCSHCYIIDRAKTAYCPDCKKVKKTSQDIPMVDVLNKIKDEIEAIDTVKVKLCGCMNIIKSPQRIKDEVLDIIDKYRTESEEV
jgi:hypothetical protein